MTPCSRRGSRNTAAVWAVMIAIVCGTASTRVVDASGTATGPAHGLHVNSVPYAIADSEDWTRVYEARATATTTVDDLTLPSGAPDRCVFVGEVSQAHTPTTTFRIGAFMPASTFEQSGASTVRGVAFHRYPGKSISISDPSTGSSGALLLRQ